MGLPKLRGSYCASARDSLVMRVARFRMKTLLYILYVLVGLGTLGLLIIGIGWLRRIRPGALRRNSRLLIVASVLTLAAYAIATFLAIDGLSDGAVPNLTTHARSDNLLTATERVRFLARYVRLRSPIRDAAFVIDYHDNGTGLIPGPSDWTIWTGIKLPHGVLLSWLAGLRPCSNGVDAKLDSILPEAWDVSSTPRCFTGDGHVWLVHDAEDVLVSYSATH
jgi:hypothetical protein